MIRSLQMKHRIKKCLIMFNMMMLGVLFFAKKIYMGSGKNYPHFYVIISHYEWKNSLNCAQHLACTRIMRIFNCLTRKQYCFRKTALITCFCFNTIRNINFQAVKFLANQVSEYVYPSCLD